MAGDGQHSLGKILKMARENKKLSLRTVEEVADISNAYLSQLENEKVSKPSANILHKLANLYNIDFNFLLSVSGIVEQHSNENKSFGKYIFSKDNLTKDEEEELFHYLKYIRSRPKKKQ
jgi:transcriptional regulator with XRE-family HTH domain